MKLIFAGATGYIGGGAFNQAIRDPRITSIVALTRKDDPRFNHAKVKKIIHDDFSTYSPEVLEQVRSAGACIWAIGGLPYKFPDMETAYAANVTYPLALANALVKDRQSEEGLLRFIYVSGTASERDMEKKHWLMPDARRHKGEAENGLISLADDNKDLFEVHTMRVGKVFDEKTGVLTDVYAMGLRWTVVPTIKIHELSAALVAIAVEGYEKQVVQNQELVELGREVLKLQKDY